ncbi:MAG: alanine dehydrogenase/pyridine nucleotide transhydrogenase [Gammaproteobacteria bacterium]|nr:alanine dehydrogenase/pyridine nucleotide transhydrogenase [Gammaproteobacteria bacterium]
MPIGSSDRINVGVLVERASGERRVALIPADIKKLTSKVTFVIESGAGREAGFDDNTYVDAGARIANLREILGSCDVVVKVRPPGVDEMPPAGRILVSLGGHDPNLGEFLRKRSVIHLALERIPRTTRAQAMDVLSSQASIAGYASVLEGARALGILLPMLIAAAGTIKPAKMIALGAGVAGLQAIATARRLGAVVHGFDVRAAAREQVESLGAKFVSVDANIGAGEGAGGYAREQSSDQQAQLRRALSPHLATMQLVITTALIPGHAAPLLIDRETLGLMKPGSVIVDLAAETGGNCEVTRPDETVTVNGVRIMGPTNLPSIVASDASRLFSGNIRSLLAYLLEGSSRLQFDASDPISGPMLAGQSTARTSLAAA